MDLDRRAQLLEKRRHLQARARRAEVARTFRRVAPLLCERGLRFSKLMPAQCVQALGKLTDGPGQDERLLWDGIVGAVRRSWSSPNERDAHLREAIAACTEPEARVAIVWHPCEAGLRMRAADFADHASLVLDGYGDTTWIVDAAGGTWLIEIAFWDREICYARSMQHR